MSDEKWEQAVAREARARGVWALNRSTRHVGRVVAYSSGPMVLIETDDGEQVWWGAGLCELVTCETEGHGEWIPAPRRAMNAAPASFHCERCGKRLDVIETEGETK